MSYWKLNNLTASPFCKVVDLSSSLAIAASKLGLAHNLPMADSIILSTAKEFKATIWTQDSDFKDMDDVKYFSRK